LYDISITIIFFLTNQQVSVIGCLIRWYKFMRNIFFLQIFQYQFFRIVMTETPSDSKSPKPHRKAGQKLTINFFFFALLDLPPCNHKKFRRPEKRRKIATAAVGRKMRCLRPKAESAFFLKVNNETPQKAQSNIENKFLFYCTPEFASLHHKQFRRPEKKRKIATAAVGKSSKYHRKIESEIQINF